MTPLSVTNFFDIVRFTELASQRFGGVGRIAVVFCGQIGSVMPDVRPYYNSPELTTFSVHPYSAAAGKGEGDHFSVLSTESSYVAYNDRFDHEEFRKSGSEYQKYGV